MTDPEAAIRTERPDDHDADAARERSTHWIRRGIVLAILAGGLVAAVLYLRDTDLAPAAEHPVTASAEPLEVAVVRLEQRTIPLTPRFLGQTESSQIVEIRSRIQGYLLERGFEEGQRVEAGQLLFRIDSEPFEIELASAEASLASAQARHRQATQQLERYQELFSRGSVAPNELEEWVAAERVASAQVAQEASRIAKAKLDLDYTTIEAPISGVIGRTLKDAGTYVDDMTDGLLAILRQIDPIYVRYAISEREMLRWQRLAREGRVVMPELDELELSITLGDGTLYPHRGRIKFVDVEVDPSTGTTVVRGTVPNPDGFLKPGQFVHVTVHGIERVDALVVPQRAVIQSPTGPTVFVAGEDGIAEQRAVALADWVGDEWIVESGLAPGDRVITERLLEVRTGTAVAPRATTATPR